MTQNIEFVQLAVTRTIDSWFSYPHLYYYCGIDFGVDVLSHFGSISQSKKYPPAC